jgi:AcrR family transcriptional regulator
MASVTRKKHSGRAQTRGPAKERLLAAVEELLERGYSYTELSVERLIQEAGISRSTFYLHFADKGDLLRALTADLASQLAGATSGCWDLRANSTAEDLRRTLGELVSHYLPHADLLAAVVEAAGYDTTVRDHWAALMGQTIDDAAAHIRIGQRSGIVRTDVDATHAAQWLIWMIERGLYQLTRHAAPSVIEELVTELAAILWCRLYQSPT